MMTWLRVVYKSPLARGLIFVFILKLAWYLIFFSFLVDKPYSRHLFVDISAWRPWFDMCVSPGLLPYIDFTREYPVFTGLFFCHLAFLFDHQTHDQAVRIHAYLIFVLDMINAGIFIVLLRSLKVSGRRLYLGLLFFQFNATALWLGPFRFEALLMTTVLTGYLAYLSGYTYISSFFWGVGFNIKWLPVFIEGIRDYKLFSEKKFRQAFKCFLIFLIVSLVPNILIGIVSLSKGGEFSSVLKPILYHIERPLYWDTFLGVTSLWVGQIQFERYADKLSLILMLFFLLRKPKQPFEVKCCLVMAAMLVFNRVYSTQFHLWFYPFLIILMVQSKARVAMILGVIFILADVSNILVYPFGMDLSYREMGSFSAGLAREKGGFDTIYFTTIVYLRALILIALMIALDRLSFRHNVGNPSQTSFS